MTTNIPPADPDRRLLHVEDPSELLAETRICLRRIPTDCLILLSSGPDHPPVLTTSDLEEVLGPEGCDSLTHHLALVQGRGCTRARAVVVLGDGHQALPEGLSDDVAMLASARLLLTASEMPGEPFDIDSAWVAGDGQCRQVVRGAPDGDEERFWISPPEPLRPFSETCAAAGEVFTGRPIPQPPREEPELARIAGRLRLERTELSAACDPGELFAAARNALARLGARDGEDGDEGFVTDCEHVAELLSVLAVDRLHWELLAQCIDRGNEGSIDRGELLQILVSERHWRPDPDVCAGGSWYVALERLRVIAEKAWSELPDPQRGIAREAWRGLTALLVLLAWWNHRFATAGRLVDELREREPGSTLAPLLARMTDTPIFPAWWPST
ncbi:hypothetical protein BH708_01640 [Brachybacterium sp. P6-10-X1]|uniref:hypothetical protein n=1 Tax=Brachybacterium sp. P6-10-X1 TaxID=1903186 RepID=UPI000971841A|nr:hypothetical protein [Brachybacterium sp. P6-10-X1]APX31630.1 hypothetical protein BH708_01640 [Brachybacterium sp. P6-10-X1]